MRSASLGKSRSKLWETLQFNSATRFPLRRWHHRRGGDTAMAARPLSPSHLTNRGHCSPGAVVDQGTGPSGPRSLSTGCVLYKPALCQTNCSGGWALPKAPNPRYVSYVFFFAQIMCILLFVQKQCIHIFAPQICMYTQLFYTRTMCMMCISFPLAMYIFT